MHPIQTRGSSRSGLAAPVAWPALLALVGLALPATTAQANGKHGRFCSRTASLQFLACKNEVKDDFFIAQASCINLSDADEREECFGDAHDERVEARELCGDQLEARRELCDVIGEDRYEPDFDPENFDDDFANPTTPNPYFPLVIGTFRELVGGDETTVVTVTDKTKLIDGVTCLVVNDVVSEDGVPIEDTDDWFGLRKDGTLDYCGESVQDFEVFDGDDPEEPELVSREGSFKAGSDGALSGTLFPGNPQVGDTYRQEWSANNAEDVATVISTTYGYGVDDDLDQLVPQDLAELLCADHDCVVTRDFTPIEPGSVERKYYARGIGAFLEVKPEDGEVTQLVDCSLALDPRCAMLPAP